MYTDYFSGSATGVNGLTTVGTTHGTWLDVSMRDNVGFVLSAASISTGNGVFSIDGTNDGVNIVSGLAFQDATATASTTYVVSKTLSSNTAAGVYLPECPFKQVRVTCVVTTDGAYTATCEAKS